MRLESGARLGPYEITGRVGAGGMGEVYRARDTRLSREVAIKVLPHEVIRDAERVARFKREACSASALNHRNIVTVHDFHAGADEAWLVMELIRGESLRELISRGALPVKKVISIGSGIADGLAAAHAAGIVHRDLKPENVMISGDGTPKILDFGLVKQAAPASDTKSPTDMQVSRSGMIMGTAAYMSPEQARGGEVDFRTDQFSLGMILHEMATGKHPFARPSGVETLAAILNHEPEPLGDHCPDALASIIERCLAKKPEERYGSTSDLAYDLHRLANRTETHRPAAAQRIPKRNWWPVALMIAIAIAVLALWPRRARVPASFQLSVAAPEFTQIFRDELSVPVALSPDGRLLLLFGTTVTDGLPALWLHDLRTNARRQIAANTFIGAFSPDSKSIAYFAEGKLKTVPVEGGPPRIICDARPEGVPSWRGNNILFSQFTVAEPGVYRVAASGGTPRLVAEAHAKRRDMTPLYPEFLPDGKHFLYLVLLYQGMQKGVIDHELYVGSIEGEAPKRVPATIDSRAMYANGSLLFVRDGTLIAQPFDPEAVRFTGEPKPVVDGVHYFRSTGLAAFSVSDDGVLAWRRAQDPSRLVWFDRAGTELKTLGTAAFNPDGRFSADGRRYAVSIVDPKTGLSDVWIYDLERDSAQRVTFRALDEKAPLWAHDGASLYYRGDGAGPPDIFRLKPGAETGELAYSGPAVEEPHDVSRDGKWMLFVQYMLSTRNIHVLSLDGRYSVRPFAVTPFIESSPRFSPDARWVAYESDVSGRPEVYVRAFDGAGAPIRLSRDGGTLPRWGRDGREVLFLAPGGKITSATIREGVITAGPRTLMQAPDAIDFEIAPDGTRLLVQLQPRIGEADVNVLTHWPTRIGGD